MKISVAFFLIPNFLICSMALADQTIPPGQFTIAGITVSCGPAPTHIVSNLNDLAYANGSGIWINMPVFQNLPPTVQLFTYAHECGHINQILNHLPINEDEADFFALKLGKMQGFLNINGVQLVCSYLWSSTGDWTHRPGPVRCNNMLIAFSNI